MLLINGETYLITSVNPLKAVRPDGEYHIKVVTRYESGEWLTQVKFAPDICKSLKSDKAFESAPAYG